MFFIACLSIFIVSCFAQEDCSQMAKGSGTEAVIYCTIEDTPGQLNVTEWSHNGQQVPHDLDSYMYINDSLVIKKVDYSKDLGVWNCTAVDVHGSVQKGNAILSATPIVKKFPSSKNLVEGDPLVLNCEIEGAYPSDLHVEWEVGGVPLDDPRAKFSDYKDVQNASLRLEGTTFNDKNEYTCVAFNSCGNGTSTILVRIKDKLAALWPFLGICAEVAILCTIIFIYERSRSKKQKEELDKEGHEAEALANSHVNREEVRQRKA